MGIPAHPCRWSFSTASSITRARGPPWRPGWPRRGTASSPPTSSASAAAASPGSAPGPPPAGTAPRPRSDSSAPSSRASVSTRWSWRATPSAAGSSCAACAPRGPADPRVRGLVLESASGYPQARPPFHPAAGRPARVAAAQPAGPRHRSRHRPGAGHRAVHPSARLPRPRQDPGRAGGRGRRHPAGAEHAVRLPGGGAQPGSRRHRPLHLAPTGRSTCPTLVLWGAGDRIVPSRFATLFEAELPDAALHVFDECGARPPPRVPRRDRAAHPPLDGAPGHRGAEPRPA